jgi:hypothetical protein
MSSTEGDDPFADVPDDVLESINAERMVRPDESNVEFAQRLLDEALPSAVVALVQTATHGANEATRFKAQQYIIERRLGKVGEPGMGDADPIMALLGKLSQQPIGPTSAS